MQEKMAYWLPVNSDYRRGLLREFSNMRRLLTEEIMLTKSLSTTLGLYLWRSRMCLAEPSLLAKPMSLHVLEVNGIQSIIDKMGEPDPILVMIKKFCRLWHDMNTLIKEVKIIV
jgi:hypothetical protein